MNVLSTKYHGVLDYTMSIVMFTSPWLLGFANNMLEMWLMVIFGGTALLYSLCTNYELGILEELDIRTHLTLDFFLGILLTLSPWLFGFYDIVYIPFLILGTLEIASTIITPLNSNLHNKSTAT